MKKIFLVLFALTALSSLYANPTCITATQKLAAWSGKKLFEGDARKNFEEAIVFMKKTALIDSKDAASLINASTKTNLGIFDISSAERVYGRPATEINIADALLVVETERARQKISALQLTDPYRIPLWLRQTGQHGKKALRWTFAAVILTGAFASFSGLGAPLWDFVSAKSRQFAFWATSDGHTKPSSTIDADLNRIYRETNGTFSGTAQIAGNRVSYLESVLMNAKTSLETNKDPEWQTIVLSELQRLVERFADILQLKASDGDHAREMLKFIQKTYDPNSEILKF